MSRLSVRLVVFSSLLAFGSVLRAQIAVTGMTVLGTLGGSDTPGVCAEAARADATNTADAANETTARAFMEISPP